MRQFHPHRCRYPARMLLYRRNGKLFSRQLVCQLQNPFPRPDFFFFFFFLSSLPQAKSLQTKRLRARGLERQVPYKHWLKRILQTQAFVFFFFFVSFFVFSSSKTIPYQHELKYCIRPTSRAQRQPCKHRPTSIGLQAGGLERHSYKHNPFILPTQPDQHYPTNTILQTQTVDHVVPHG